MKTGYSSIEQGKNEWLEYFQKVGYKKSSHESNNKTTARKEKK